MSDRLTPDLSNQLMPVELDQIGKEILKGGPRAIRYRETRAGGKSMVFVAHHDEVVRVLSDEDDFSLCHYNPLYSAIAPRGAFIVMRPKGPEREERLAILKAAAARTPWFGPGPAPRDLARASVDNVLAAVRRRRRFDLISEYGFFVPYLVAKRVLGLAGPRSFSLLPWVYLLNGHSILQIFRPETRPYLTNLVWSEFVVAQLMTNLENRKWYIRIAARCGASGLRTQIERYIDASPRTAGDQTLLNALWAVRGDFPQVKKDDVYREHVVSIMTELTGTFLLTLGLGFTASIKRWRGREGLGLEQSLQPLRAMNAVDFAQEQLRLAPPSAYLLRNATGPVALGELTLEPGEYVCALIGSKGVDIPNPGEVMAGRCPNTYLHFGPEDGPHRCFGHLLAPAILAEMFLGLTRLPNLAPRGVLTERISLNPGRLMVDFGEPVGTDP